jgi:general secretion pathway protein D
VSFEFKSSSLKKIKILKASLSIVLFIGLVFGVLFSCSQGRLDPIIDNVGATEKDLKDSIIKKRSKSKNSKFDDFKDQPLPKLSKSIVPVPAPKIGGEKIISFYVTDQVPLRDVLIELGRIAEVDVDVDPKISGGVIINAKNRPFKEIIDRIASQGKLRYSYKNKVLYFETDKPSMKNYFVDYLDGSPLWDEVQTNIENIFNAESYGQTNQSTITPNKSAGMYTIYATQRQHQSIEKYLQDVSTQSSVQVLIEAKVVEVRLSEKFRAGIDWSQDLFKFNSPDPDSNYAGMLTVNNPALNIFNGDINIAVDAMSKFGVTKAISSPRIHAMNNQKAALNFADKLVYFKVESQQSAQGTTTGASATTVATTITSTKQEENVGVQIEITPSVNIKTGEISMNIAPKITAQSDSVKDPATADTKTFSYANTVPIINTREINTSVKIASGNVLVIGGLMKNTDDSKEGGIPFLRRIPILGWLFKSLEKSSEVSETVIFIKATIINSGTRADKIDRELQEKYDTNRRTFF